MSALPSLQTLIGTWTGMNRLILPEEPPHESESTAVIAVIAQGKFSTISYTWVFNGEPQEGLITVGYDAGQGVVNGIFIDSWHMGDKFMVLQGQVVAPGTIDVRGSYAVEGSPDWGWRVVIEPSETSWQMLMYNVSPEGEEYLGVEATYTRTV